MMYAVAGTSLRVDEVSFHKDRVDIEVTRHGARGGTKLTFEFESKLDPTFSQREVFERMLEQTLQDAAVHARFTPAPERDAPVTLASVAHVREELGKLAGKPVLVSFWATWCPPCLKELPLLAKLHRDFGPEGLAFYGVSLDLTAYDEPEAMERIGSALRENGIQFDGALLDDDEAAVDEEWDLGDTVPVTILLDASGREAARVRGMLKEEAARTMIERLLRSPSP